MPWDAQTVGVLAVLFGAVLVQAVFGFGCALVAMPLLSMVLGVEAATPLVALVATTMALVNATRDWRQVQVRSGSALLLWTAVGVPAGLLWLKGAPAPLVKGLLGALLIGFAALSLARPPRGVLSGDGWACPFGLAAGVLGGAYNTAGPPAVIYGTLRGWPPDHFRATLQGYFVPQGLCVIVGHGLAGLWTRDIFAYYLAGLPAAAAGLLLGRWLAGRFPAAKFTAAVHALLILLGGLLLAQAAAG